MPKYNQEIRNVYAGLGISDEFNTDPSVERDQLHERYVYESTKKQIQIGFKKKSSRDAPYSSEFCQTATSKILEPATMTTGHGNQMKILVDTLRTVSRQGGNSVKNVRSPWMYTQTANSLNKASKNWDSQMGEYDPDYVDGGSTYQLPYKPASQRGPNVVAART